ncbi:hypothetical protein WH52_05925 [Tenacibaculum holothuriorum]|uniref:Metallo-beta-lactamase domain-containing protein n=2 Tax=Tenacibaculum holothuriorum TaxID=1635173 RepID=A0A1Y2PFU1_9FLAO|nr:hypothetical protein WH52_05925 [Tenacibaculum holothuriorum]
MNCYVLERNNKCFIIDPGYQKETIQAYIKREKLEVIGILLTHAHIDHIEALDCFNVPVYLHEEEVEILLNDNLNGFGYFKKQKAYDINKIEVVPINESSIVELEGHEISVIFTPGHTKGGVCYKIGHDIYTGDTLFEGSVGKWDRPTANLEHLKESVLKLIDKQPEHMLIHPGHGSSSTIGTEKRFNPFYAEWKQEQLINI